MTSLVNLREREDLGIELVAGGDVDGYHVARESRFLQKNGYLPAVRGRPVSRGRSVAPSAAAPCGSLSSNRILQGYRE